MTKLTLDLWLIIKINLLVYLYSIFKSVISLDVEHVLLEIIFTNCLWHQFEQVANNKKKKWGKRKANSTKFIVFYSFALFDYLKAKKLLKTRKKVIAIVKSRVTWQFNIVDFLETQFKLNFKAMPKYLKLTINYIQLDI